MFRDVLKINSSVLRLFFFLLLFLLLCHFSACLWVIIAILSHHGEDPNDPLSDPDWLDKYSKYTDFNDAANLYMVSFYWTITTITTVGYGDIVANNFAERVFCACMMIIGVISFSFANGSLTSILSHNDQ